MLRWGVGYGYWAYGSQSYVLGAAIGNAIGNAMLQHRYFTNCMAMSGWKKMNVASGKAQRQVKQNFTKRATTTRKCRDAKSMSEMLSNC